MDSLTVLVEQERGDSEELVRQLKEEMEELLGDLAVLEDQERCRKMEVSGSQETVQRLQEERGELESQLSDTRAQLER